MHRSWQWFVADSSLRVGVTTSRRDLTTSTAVLAGGAALLVDPSWDPDELAGLAADLIALDVRVAAGFATHSHHDHLLWHPELGPAPRFASPRATEICARDRAGIVAELGPDWPADLAELVGRVSATEARMIDWPGPAVYPLTHDAHSPGHTALWVPDAGVLIAGDMLSDVELPLLETSTAAEYLAGLELLRPYVARASVLIPGHGRPAIGTEAAIARWRADHAYLTALAAGADPVDARRHNSGMAQAHADNVHRRTQVGGEHPVV